jgi:hypothetical protein
MVSYLNAARAAAGNWLACPGVVRRAFGNKGRQGKPSSEAKMTGLPTAGTVQPQLLSWPLPYLAARENAPGKKQAALATFFPREREKSTMRASCRDDSGESDESVPTWLPSHHRRQRPCSFPPFQARARVVSHNWEYLSQRVKSARGQAQSKTLRVFWRMGERVSVLDCACPLALWPASVHGILRHYANLRRARQWWYASKRNWSL